MAHKGPNSERNYMAPPNLRPTGFPGRAKVAVFAVLTGT